MFVIMTLKIPWLGVKGRELVEAFKETHSEMTDRDAQIVEDKGWEDEQMFVSVRSIPAFQPTCRLVVDGEGFFKPDEVYMNARIEWCEAQGGESYGPPNPQQVHDWIKRFRDTMQAKLKSK